MTNPPINNQVYDELGERWYTAQDDPIALLRAEAALRNSWVKEVALARWPRTGEPAKCLDIGCGGGFLSNALAQEGLDVTGVDLSEASLAVARAHDKTSAVTYLRADAYALPFENQSFDIVCAMDFLEHVTEPGRVIAEAARVLRPGGLFFFYTFDRNPLSWLIAIKGVEWFVRNTPSNLHLYEFFIRPRELSGYCTEAGLRVAELRGARPVVRSRAFWQLLRTGVVPRGFRFRWTGSTLIAYAGYAEKVKTK